MTRKLLHLLWRLLTTSLYSVFLARSMLATARDVLGYDLQKICMEGPKEQLENTVYSQPALFVAGQSLLRWLNNADAYTIPTRTSCEPYRDHVCRMSCDPTLFTKQIKLEPSS